VAYLPVQEMHAAGLQDHELHPLVPDMRLLSSQTSLNHKANMQTM
jgi:hypothetical protein